MKPEPRTILIADDEPANRKLLETLLQADGYLTIAVASGDEALAAVAREPPALILLDVRMPGMDGYQVAKKLKGNPASASIPIIMLTASRDLNAKVEGLNAGAEDLLSRPIDRSELWLKVRNLLRLQDATRRPKSP